MYLKRKLIISWCCTLLLINIPFKHCWALDGAAASISNPTCNLKDNCNLNDKILSMTSETTEQSDGDLKSKIASIFEDKINYSLKLFPEETVIDLKTFEHNLNDMPVNFTLMSLPNQNNIVDDEREFISTIAHRWISLSQPFDASRNSEASELCRQHTKLYFEGLNNFELWALKMHDATGKFTSGILNGNINQHGDFDECLSVEHSSKSDNALSSSDGDKDDEIRGKYCLAYVQPVFSYKSERLQSFFELLQSYRPFISEFDDPGHRVPRYSLINWGICAPSSCSAKDIEYSVKEFLNNMTTSTGLSFKVRVEPQMCTVRDNKPWDRNTTWTIRFFAAIVFISVLSTIYNRYTKNRQQNEWLTVFALDKNWNWIFDIKDSADDIKTVHGLRFFNALMLLMSHKSMAMFFNAYNNRTEMAKSLGRPWTVIGRAASLYTDPFLLISGLLTAYSLFGRLNKGQPIRLKNEYISRLIRIVPPLAALILFCTYVLPLIDSGPQWNLVIGHHADLCKKNWWRNLLFIHNYFGFSEMCLTHTHHLGIDTELFAVAPVMILVIWKWPKMGIVALLSLCGIGTGARYYTTVINDLSNYIYFGTNIKRLFRTADYMYSFPPMRSTVYLMGVFLGYILRLYPNMKLSTTQLRLGWFCATICIAASFLGPAPMGDISYTYNSTHAAIYAAFAPIAWCSFFSWIVFVSHNGYDNKLTQFFSWKYFQISTKLSYAIYLAQFPVYFYNVGRRRHIHHYYNFIATISDTNEYACIFLASIILTLLFDAPFQNIKKLFLRHAQSTKKPIQTSNGNVIRSSSNNMQTTSNSSKHSHVE